MRLTKRLTSVLLALSLVIVFLSISVSAWNDGAKLEVYWNNEFAGSITYDEMENAIENVEPITYSVKPIRNGQSSITASVYTFDQLMDYVGKSEEWSNAAYDTSVTFQYVYKNNQISLEKSKGYYADQRYYYSEDEIAEYSVPFGFYLSDDGGFSTIFGQESPSEENKNWFINFRNEDAQIYIDTTTADLPSNNWISFQENVSFVGSDADNDYYQLNEPVEQLDDFNNKTRFIFRYSVNRGQGVCPAQIQTADGESVSEEISTYDSAGSASRSVTLYGLDNDSDYRLFWDASSSNNYLKKNVVLNFFTPKEIFLTLSEENLYTESRPVLTVENGLPDYKYEFKVYNIDNKAWWTIQELSTSNSCSWYAGPGPGKKRIEVEIKKADGSTYKTITKEVYVSKIESDSDLTLENYNSSIGERQLFYNSTTTLSVDASGGTAPYYYRFRVYNNSTRVWYTIQDFTKDSNSCKWWAGPESGSKTIYIDVRDSKGDTFMMVVPVVVRNPLVVNSLTLEPNTLTKNTTTTLTAKASGGFGGIFYRFRVYNKDTGVWWTIQDYKKNGNTCQWWAGPAAGNKVIYVDVKDDGGGNSYTYTQDVVVTD